MSIKHIWSVLCKTSIVDQEENNISINSVLEELSVVLTPLEGEDGFPKELTLPINYEIVSLWQRDLKAESPKAEIEYILLDPDKHELLKQKHDIEVLKPLRRHRSRMKIAGLPLTKEGDYIFQVKIKEEGSDESNLVAELPLEVKITLQKASEKPREKN